MEQNCATIEVMKLRHFIFFLAIVVIAVLLIFQFGQIQNFINLLKTAHWWILLLVIPLRYLYYWANAKYFAQFFSIFHQKKVNKRYLLEATVTMNFVNIVFPSAGISGISYIRKALNGRVDSANTTLAQLVWYLLSFTAYIFLLLIGFIMLLLSNQVIRISSRIILLVVIVILLIGITIIVLMANRGLSENLAFLLARPVNFLMRRVHKHPYGKERIRNFLDQMRDSIDFLQHNQKALVKPFISAAAMVILDMASVYVVFLAFGQVVNPGIVITGYVIALLTSLVAVLTAGIGAYEAGMVATFVGLGIPFDLAVSVTITYRVIALWMFLPVGLYFYKRTLLDNDSEQIAKAPDHGK